MDDDERDPGAGAHGGEGPPVSGLEALPVPELLEHIESAAFLIAPGGRVLHANTAGREIDARAPRLLAEALRRAIALRGDAGFEISTVAIAGLPRCHLAVRRRQPAEPVARARLLAIRWGLTGRQREVLAEVARGRTNKAVAAALGCAEATVELHVTSLLERASCPSRAALVARFWAEEA